MKIYKNYLIANWRVAKKKLCSQIVKWRQKRRKQIKTIAWISYHHSLCFHAADDAPVVLVAPDASLELMEEIAQLHAYNEARHAEEDVAPQLQRKHNTNNKMTSPPTDPLPTYGQAV